MMSARVFTQSVEDYVKSIHDLQGAGQAVSTNDLARAMGNSAAAASKMLKHLASLRLVDYAPRAGARLTAAGERVALEILRHHRLLELYLHEALGYGWDEVHAEADALEHHVSEAFEARISALLGDPAVDPHGYPIPTRDGRMAPLRGEPLADAHAGDRVIVRRVRDTNAEALRFLSRLGLGIGTEVEVTEKQPFNGPLMLEIEGVPRTIGRELAAQVFVEAAHERRN